MDTMPGNDPMENPPPLAGLDPADLLRQGAADDTFADGAPTAFNPPPVEELAAIFPQFEILELIGQGGMGAVYKVRQKDLDRIVALKILPPGIGQSPEFSNRFTREARALAKLNHPGIVTLHEFGQQDGLYFILMEFVDGVNLAQLMKTGRISPREALAIVPQICDALQYAHDQGIVHRDIKPENILLDRSGRVKVADFGIAKVVASVCDPIRSGDTPVTTDATLAGKIIGTPQYMAPEQIEHPSDVDHRADIYALGVVFYQMLTGELPGKDLQAPLRKVHIDVRLDEIVLKAMEKNPEQRYQQASVMRTRVDGLATPLVKQRSAGRWIVIGCGGVLLLMLVLCVLTAIAYWALKTTVVENPGGKFSNTATAVPGSAFSSERKLAEYDWEDLAEEGRLGDGVTEKLDGRTVLKIENLKDEPRQPQLLTIENPPIGAMQYAVGGEIRYENIQGKGYLEMWSHFPKGRYFSRTLEASGPLGQLSGTSGWRKFTLPFDRTGTKDAPTRIEVNLFLPGRGVVFVGPLELIEVSSDETADGRATAPPAMIRTDKPQDASMVDSGSAISVKNEIFFRELPSANRLQIRMVAPDDPQAVDAVQIREDGTTTPLKLSANVVVCDQHVKDAGIQKSSDGYGIMVTLNEVGEKRLAAATKGADGKMRLAVIVDGEVKSAPVVMSQLGRQFVVEGFSDHEKCHGIVRGLVEWPGDQDLSAMTEWLEKIDHGDAGQAWTMASEYFRQNVTREKWNEMATAARQPLGGLVTRRLLSAKRVESPPGAPDGLYLVSEFESSFENKKRAKEVVSLKKDEEDRWRVCGYFVL